MAMHAGREDLRCELKQMRKHHEEEVERIKQLDHKELQRRIAETIDANSRESEWKW